MIALILKATIYGWLRAGHQGPMACCSTVNSNFLNWSPIPTSLHYSIPGTLRRSFLSEGAAFNGPPPTSNTVPGNQTVSESRQSSASLCLWWGQHQKYSEFSMQFLFREFFCVYQFIYIICIKYSQERSEEKKIKYFKKSYQKQAKKYL